MRLQLGVGSRRYSDRCPSTLCEHIRDTRPPTPKDHHRWDCACIQCTAGRPKRVFALRPCHRFARRVYLPPSFWCSREPARRAARALGLIGRLVRTPRSPGGEHLPRRRVDVDDPEGLDVLLADHGDDPDARRQEIVRRVLWRRAGRSAALCQARTSPARSSRSSSVPNPATRSARPSGSAAPAQCRRCRLYGMTAGQRDSRQRRLRHRDDRGER